MYFITIIGRERNRVHARNTRERKKMQMSDLQTQIEMLQNEVSTISSSNYYYYMLLLFYLFCFTFIYIVLNGEYSLTFVLFLC